MLQSLLGLDFTIPASIFALGDILTPALQAHFGNESFPCDFLPGIKAVLNTTILQQSGFCCWQSLCIRETVKGGGSLPPGSPILLELGGLCRGSVTLLQVARPFLSSAEATAVLWH